MFTKTLLSTSLFIMLKYQSTALKRLPATNFYPHLMVKIWFATEILLSLKNLFHIKIGFSESMRTCYFVCCVLLTKRVTVMSLSRKKTAHVHCHFVIAILKLNKLKTNHGRLQKAIRAKMVTYRVSALTGTRDYLAMDLLPPKH